MITLREGLEAVFIIGITLSYLSRSENRQAFKSIWLGTSLATAVSMVAGAAIYYTAGKLEGKAEEIFEGIALLMATGVLTWMCFWMRRQVGSIKTQKKPAYCQRLIEA